MPTVSLCMIVRNEQDHIEQCLQAAQPYVDEIIVVDTGSDDQTAAIAEQCGARLFRFKWIDHFAHARNFSIKRATGDWILVLDADEHLQPVDPDIFQGLIADETAAGYYVAIRQHRSDSPGDYEVDSVCRLFRNLPGVAYRGRVHEDICMSLSLISPQLAIKHSKLILSHYGYLREAAQLKQKAGRNRKLLELAVREESDTLYYRYALGVESFIEENYPQAAKELAPLLPLVPPSAGYAADLSYKLAYAGWRSGQPAAALQAVETGLVRDPLHADLQELHGILLLEADRPEEACHSFTRLARKAHGFEEQQQDRLHYWLGLVHLQLGNWQESLLRFKQCLSSNSYRKQALPYWLDLCLLMLPTADVVSKLDEPGHRFTRAEARALLCQHAMKWGLGEQLLPLLEAEEQTEQHPYDRRLTFFHAVLLAQADQPERAFELLNQLLLEKPEKHVIVYLWALQNRGMQSLVQLNLLYEYREFDAELGLFADALLQGSAAQSAYQSLLGQAMYAMLTMKAWSGFLLLWQHSRSLPSGEPFRALSSAWRSAVYRAPENVRRTIWQELMPSASPPYKRLGDHLFTAQLAYSLGDITESKRLFNELRDGYPQRLEPRIGLYGAVKNSDEWASFLFLADQ